MITSLNVWPVYTDRRVDKNNDQLYSTGMFVPAVIILHSDVLAGTLERLLPMLLLEKVLDSKKSGYTEIPDK